MSYSSYSSQANAYREREINSASPARLVVLVYDAALANMLRARRSLQSGDIRERVSSVGKARDAIMELVVTLDTDRGGEIARNLKSLYAFILSELSDVVPSPDAVRLERVIKIVTDLRSAFDTIANDAARVTAA